MTDIGLTGGGKGTHQIYLNGEQHHRIQDGSEDLVSHIVAQVEAKAKEIASKLPAPVKAA